MAGNGQRRNDVRPFEFSVHLSYDFEAQANSLKIKYILLVDDDCCNHYSLLIVSDFFAQYLRFLLLLNVRETRQVYSRSIHKFNQIMIYNILWQM